MGLFGQILGGILSSGSQSSGAPAQPQPQQAHSMLSSVLGMLNSPKIGGLAGLMALMHSKGMGSLISGWVAKGPNPAITPAQLQQTIGDDHIKQFATEHGLSEQDAASTISQLLPHVVDHMTPDGSVPQQGMDMGSMLEMLKQKLA